ncbi:MAG TPA: hypothetical protein VH255_04220 [Verrucomicrobiae bacterium]|nr:hypothetical protein [Verrucomicrobiae bacterium]
MNLHEVLNLVAGILQFIVAGYSLRLNRIFGTARVGWSLFAAFSLLALLHLVQSLASFSIGVQPGIEFEVIYSLISLLLLTGMLHLEALLKERQQLELAQARLKAALETEVQKKTAHLTEAVEQLRCEMDERKRMETVVEKTNTQFLIASRQVKMAQIATRVLYNMGDMLKSINFSTSLISDQVRESKITNVVRIGALIREHGSDLGEFMAHDPRGQKLPLYIAQLGEYLSNEQVVLAKEMNFLRTNLDEIVEMQQNYTKLANMADGATTETQQSPNNFNPFAKDEPTPAERNSVAA